MFIILQVRIDFVDTEMLTPTEGSCKDQYMSISGGCQGVSNKPCTSQNLIILHQQIYMFFIIFQDRSGQLDLAASVVLILINIFTYISGRKKISNILIFQLQQLESINPTNLVSVVDLDLRIEIMNLK